MPWTRKQVKYLESDDSPLTRAQKDKMNAELHANPAMGHAKKQKVTGRRATGFNWRNRHGLKKVG